MRTRLFALSLVWGCIAAGAIAACGDDSSGDASGEDASPDASSPPPADGSIGAPAIAAGDVVVYTGMIASVDGSGTTAQSLAWALKSVPNGSKVTSANLAGATTAIVSFPTDVSGDYVLTLTAKNTAAETSKDVTVKAVPAPLFYTQTNFTEEPVYFEYRTVGTDGTGGHPVACRTNGVPDGGTGQLRAFVTMSAFLADIGVDWWEAPPGDPSRVAFAEMFNPDAGEDETAFALELGTSQSTCQSPPVTVGQVPEDGGIGGQGLIQPRFSRSGNRVAYHEERASGWYVAAVSHDGKDRRDLARACPDSSGSESCFKPSLFPPRPQWLDDQTVGWVRQRTDDGGAGWEVVVANDSANPQPKTYMTCTGVVPPSFAFLKDGAVIANSEVDGVENLTVYRPSAVGGECKLVKKLTSMVNAGSYARDFAVSPDDKEVAFVRRELDAGEDSGAGVHFGGDVYTVPVSGATPPAPVTGTPQNAYFGPRYVAGASMLAWNGVVPDAGEIDGGGLLDGGLPGIAVVLRDGGQVSFAVRSDPDAGTYTLGGGNGGACDFRICSLGGGRTTGASAAFFAAVAGTLLARRRRRRG